MIFNLSLTQWALVGAGVLIGFGLGIWFAVTFRDKK